jgi:hypothetical protein
MPKGMIISCEKNPEVYITQEAKSHLDAYVDICPDEISGLGHVTRKGNVLTIESILLFTQEVSSGSTDLDGDDVAKFIQEAIQGGQDPSTLKLWWHSHVNMGTFWSGTDTSTIDRFLNGWMLSIVTNKKREYKTRLDIYEPSPIRIIMDDLHLYVQSETDTTLIKRLETEVRQKVRKKTYPTTTYYSPKFYCPKCSEELINGWCNRCLKTIPWNDRSYTPLKNDRRCKTCNTSLSVTNWCNMCRKFQGAVEKKKEKYIEKCAVCEKKLDKYGFCESCSQFVPHNMRLMEYGG